MTAPRPVERLLRRVSLRLYAYQLLLRSLVALVVLTGLTLGALLVARLTAALPDVVAFEQLAVLPALALALGVLFTRWPSAEGSARALDEALGADDLFLTVTQLSSAPGGYHPLVLQRAEVRASEATDLSGLPVGDFRRAGGWSLALLIGLAAGIQWLPQLDPFGTHDLRQRAQARKTQRQKDRKAIAERKQELAKADLARAHSKDVQDAMKRLEQTMRKAKPRSNSLRKNLAKRQKELAGKWRKLTSKLLARQIGRRNAARFGAPSDDETEQVMRKLLSGDASAFSKQVEALRSLARQLANAKTEAEKKKLKKRLKRKLKKLEKAIPGSGADNPLKKALQRAVDQLVEDEAQMDEELAKALAGLDEALELSKYEAEKLAQMLRDQALLDRLLAAIQRVKALIAELKKLDKEIATSIKSSQKDGAMPAAEKTLLEEISKLTGELSQKQLSLAAAALNDKEADTLIDDATRLAKGVRGQLENVRALREKAAKAAKAAKDAEKAGKAVDPAEKAKADAARAKAQAELKAGLAALKKLLEAMKNCNGAGGMAAYKKLYAGCLGQCNGNGQGQPGNRGKGGGKVPEKDDVLTKFNKERSRSQLRAGKMLLKMKAGRSVNKTGEVPEDYDKARKAVAGNVSEAIAAEDVPAGYHDSIKRYFEQFKKGEPRQKAPEKTTPEKPAGK